jgi:hypothetical protein
MTRTAQHHRALRPSPRSAMAWKLLLLLLLLLLLPLYE